MRTFGEKLVAFQLEENGEFYYIGSEATMKQTEENLQKYLLELLEKTRDFCKRIEASSIHISSVCNEATAFRLVQALDPSNRELSQKFIDIIYPELTFSNPDTNLEVLGDEIQVQCATTTVSLVPEQDLDLIEKISDAEALIRKEYLLRKYIIFDILENFSLADENTLRMWKDTKKLKALVQDLEECTNR